MQITLITPTGYDISAFGVRALSAYLKRAGYRTRVIFLTISPRKTNSKKGFYFEYPTRLLEDICECSRDSQLIGISFMTFFFDQAVQITQALKDKYDIPIIWGGVHPSIRPQEALEYADMVCIGEGEGALLELAQKLNNGEDYSQVENIWLKRNGKIIKNPLRPLIKDLDTLPFIDFDLDEHYCIDPTRERIREMDVPLLGRLLSPLRADAKGNIQTCYRTMTDRGCPCMCSYCYISVQKEMYSGQALLRKRSVEHVIDELKQIVERYPFIDAIQFFDDTFFSRSSSDIHKFSSLYKEKIDLPFYAQATPGTITEKKMEYLIDAGMIYTEMGVQTGSRRIRKLYNRPESNQAVIRAAEIIHKYKDRLLTPHYHVILDNPWETDQDLLDTLHLILQLPKPFHLMLSTLQFFPGTKLYFKGKKEGLFQDDVREIYRVPFLKPRSGYIDFLIYLTDFQWMPEKLFVLLSSPGLIRLLNRGALSPVYRYGERLIEKLRLITRGGKALLSGDFARIWNYLKA